MYESLRRYQIVLLLVGLWPNDFTALWKIVLYELYTWFFLLHFVMVTVMRFLQAYYSQFDLELFTKASFECGFAVLLMLEILTMFVLRYKIRDIVMEMRDKFLRDQRVLEKCDWHEDVLFKALFVVELPAVLAEIVHCLLLPSKPADYRFNSYWNKTHPERRMPFPLVMPCDDTLSPCLEIEAVLVVIEIFQGIALMFFSYTLVPSFITQVCGQFKILLEKIERISDVLDQNNNEEDRESGNEISLLTSQSLKDSDVKEVVKMHDSLLNISHKVIKLMRPFIFLKTFFSFGMLSVGLFTTLTLGIGSPSFFVAGGFLVVATLELFLVCIYSENLSTSSLAVYNAAYNVSWPDMKESSKKSLLLLMLRSQRPLQLNVKSNFVPLDLNTFIQVIQTCYSFFTVLRETLGKQN
ncbi:odorant receptor Or2-like isoform X2 [Nilaparvata lugens]|nr:odorant receptor Or2-like isoform X2 [Nilaparvata lugens]